MLTFTRFLGEEDGSNAIEYGLLCSLILLVIVSSVTLFASKTTLLWSTIAAHL